MPRFIYTAKSEPHKVIQGDIEAESQQDAVNQLTKRGYFPVSVTAESLSLKERQGVLHLRKASGRDIVLFTRQLSSLIESGINIINALNTISNQSSNKYLKAALNDVINKIKDGRSLSESLAGFPDLFSPLYSAMIRAGEASGNLNNTLKRLADFLEKEAEFRNSLIASLTYPFFVLSVGVLTIFVLLTFVIPRMAVMFADMGQALPLSTRILMSIADFFHSFWWLVIAIISVSVFFLQRIHKTQQGKIALDTLKLKLALFGAIILKTEISRFCRILSLLLASGIPITPSLEISASTVENRILQSEVRRFKEEIAGGASLSGALKSSQLFPEFVTNIVTIGEETGSLEKTLSRVADDYEADVERALKGLTRLLEPVIILAMGLIVGFIVLSMLLPIFQINLIVR